MAKRTGIVSLLCLAVAACGGNDGNAAASRQFTYGTPGAATSLQTGALETSLSSMTSLSAPDVSTAMSFTEFSGVTDDLFGGSAFSFATVTAAKTALAKAQNAALLSPTAYGTGFDDPACVTVTSTSVQLSGCKITLKDSFGTLIATVKADGSVTLSNSNQTLGWDLRVSENFPVTGSGGSASVDASLHSAGNITVQAPTDAAPGTVKGSMTSEASVSASGGGQSESMRLDESLDINVTYENIPTTCVIGGTVEAKRVFADWSIPNMSRPADKGVKVTWTGCGTGEIAFSTN